MAQLFKNCEKGNEEVENRYDCYSCKNCLAPYRRMDFEVMGVTRTANSNVRTSKGQSGRCDHTSIR